ncbi:hypothetical protein ACFQ0G_53680 [Streptomyces chiangmaiensis]|uniref:hypothetical protein n=1 Tax=Streptomyces chiangmaiensis TaxID=766497 RepID=UPI0031EBB261
MARSARARNADPAELRALLAEGSAYLKSQPGEDPQKYAAAIDLVLEPGGPDMLKEPRSPLALTMTKDLRAKLEQAFEDFDTTKDALADEALLAVLNGDWLPPETVRTRSRDAEKTRSRTVLNVSVDEDLRGRLGKERLAELSREAGYPVSLSSIIISWMTEEMGISRDGKPAESAFQMQQYKTLRDHWQAVAAERGVKLDDVVSQGLRELRAGTQVLPRPVVAPRGARAGERFAKLTLRLDDELREWLVQATPGLSEQLDYGMDPGKVVTEILKLRLGTPEGWDSPAK